MLPLVVGTVLAVGALAYVLFPLFGGAVSTPRRALPTRAADAAVLEQEAVVALREIEFDRATGKLSDSDYAELKTRYTERALSAMRTLPSADEPGDAAEAAVLAWRARIRSCATCGPRPEPDAIYCSSCGSYLPGTCAGCGSAVTQPGAAFCNCCGRQLAA
ncbi:MAG: hypothetical protein JWL60_1431 [Gemmatimonadetes bacterium]|jgi:hypothetical protein|nr:hypothetical protein [Gemmatimonadota bacterium]